MITFQYPVAFPGKSTLSSAVSEKCSMGKITVPSISAEWRLFSCKGPIQEAEGLF